MLFEVDEFERAIASQEQASGVNCPRRPRTPLTISRDLGKLVKAQGASWGPGRERGSVVGDTSKKRSIQIEDSPETTVRLPETPSRKATLPGVERKATLPGVERRSTRGVAIA